MPFGYIMTKVDYGSFERYDYISRVSLGEQTGEILIRESLDMLESATSAPGEIDITEDVVYGHKDGLALSMDVYRPQKPNGAAGVVHGQWRLVFASGLRHDRLCHYSHHFLPKATRCSRFGMAVVRSTRFPMRLQTYVRAVRFLRQNEKRFDIDADRMGVMGMSAGGHLSLMLGTTGDDGDADADDRLDRVSSRVAAVVALVPPTDLRVAVWDAPESLPAYRNFPALNLPMKPAEQNSPLFHVTSDDAPSLVIMGEKDGLVPPKHGEWIDAAFEEQDVQHKLVIVPKAGHDLGGVQNLGKVMNHATGWFGKHLKAAK